MDGDEGTTNRDLDRLAASLNAGWNALARGDAACVADAPFADGVRRLHALDAPPSLSRERRARMWEEIMAAQDAATGVAWNRLGARTPNRPRRTAPQGWRAALARWQGRALAPVASAAMVAGTLVLAALVSSRPFPQADPGPGLGARLLPAAGPAATPPAPVAIEPLLEFTAEVLPTGFSWTGVVRVTYPPGEADPMTTLTGPDIARVESGSLGVAADGPVLVARANGWPASPQPGGLPVLAPETNPVLGPGDWVVVAGGRAHAFANATREGEPTPAQPAVILETMVVDAMLSGGSNENVDWYPLRSESGSAVPAAPAVVTVGAAMLAPGAVVPAPAAGVLQVVAPEKDDSMLVKAYTDGSARNTGDRVAHVYVLTVAPIAGGGATPTP